MKLEDLVLSWKLHLEVWSYTLMLEATHEANTSSLLYHVYKSFYWKKKKWSSCFCCYFFLNKLFSRYLETYFDAFVVTWWTNYFPPGNSILKGVKWSKVELRWYKRIVLNSCSNFIIVLKKTFSLFLFLSKFVHFFMGRRSDNTSYSIIVLYALLNTGPISITSYVVQEAPFNTCPPPYAPVTNPWWRQSPYQIHFVCMNES